jgi:hypothetical protein
MSDFGHGWRRFTRFAMIGVFLFGLALLASQHLQHIVGILPYLLLLACPLMHLFGHGHHHSHHQSEAQQPSRPSSLPLTAETHHGQ